MEIFNRKFSISGFWVVLIVLLLLISVFLYLFLADIGGRLVTTIWGSLVAGLIVAVIQLIWQYSDYRKLNAISELGLLKIFKDRDDAIVYGEYIKSATKTIDVLGVTAYRFFTDFADMREEATSKKKVLLDRLNNGVNVRVLLPQGSYLKKERRHRYEEVRKVVNQIKVQYPNTKLEVRYFNHIPCHSIFRVDSSCIIGPVLEGMDSQYTPGLQLKVDSELARKYLDYFESEWEMSNE